MIQFADHASRQQVREMWKTVFGDPDDYMAVYFRHKYRDENTLIYMVGDKAAASLQMLPYGFTFCGSEIPVYYLSGVSTLPEFRNRGFVRQLLEKSFDVAARNGVPLMLLVPQEEWLLEFYDRFGFAPTFDKGKTDLPSLGKLVEEYHSDLHAAFREFNSLFAQNDMTVQKTFDDFRAMVEEGALFDFPTKRNLLGMARVIDAERLLSLFADRYVQKSFSIEVRDGLIEGNNGLFTVKSGKVAKESASVESEEPGRAEASDGNVEVPKGGAAELQARAKNRAILEPLVTADIRELAQLLLGWHTSEKRKPMSEIFPEKEPQMHFMLE